MNQRLIRAPEVLDQDTGRALVEQARKQGVAKGDTVVLDLKDTVEMDTRGGAWILALSDYARANHAEFKYQGQREEVQTFVSMIAPGLTASPSRKKNDQGFFEEIGARAYEWSGEFGEFSRLLMDSIYWTIIAPFEGRGFRWNLWFDEMYEMGVKAVRINVLMNFLLGLIIAMLSAAQIAQFGLGIYVADLIVIAFARELAAIMTAIVVSARTGAAITAELSTMKVQEEIDALRGMGLNVVQFLVAPKILALLLVMPCLVALGLIAGVLGGAVWGLIVLGFRPDNWFNQTMNAVSMGDLVQGMLKTLAFAIMIVLVGCHNGFRVSGGSRGVGLMTTRSVVMDIFFIIVIDIIFATIFYYVLN